MRQVWCHIAVRLQKTVVANACDEFTDWIELLNGHKDKFHVCILNT